MIIFSTPNGRSLSYLPNHGILMLQLMGAIPADQAYNKSSNTVLKAAGVIPQEAVAAALATLKLQSSLLAEQPDTQTQANHSDNDANSASQSSNNAADEIDESEQNAYEPSVASRAYPLLQLLAAAVQEQQPVVWQDSAKV